MTRDRLQEMKQLMQDGGFQDEENVSKEEKTSSTTPFVTFWQQILHLKKDVEELQKRVKELRTLLTDNQQWANEKIRKELEKKIEEEKLIIGSSAKAIRNTLKSLKSTSWNCKEISTMQRIKDVQVHSLLHELNEILKNYLHCLQQQKERSLKIFKDMIQVKGEDISNIETLLEEGKIAIFTNNLLISDLEEKCKLREAEDRHHEILKIESSILEIRNLFNELAMIVDIQAEKVEDVEKLVDDNLATVESGRKKLEMAAKKKRKIRYSKIIITLICGGIILVVLVLLTVV